MTTEERIDEAPKFHRVTLALAPLSSCSNWEHPVLEIFRPAKVEVLAQKAKLYLIPSAFGEDFDPDFAPRATSALDLPDLHAWTLKFVVSVLEVWAGKREPAQLTRWCHQSVFSSLLRKIGSQKSVGRVRNIHQSEPLDGICESTITIRFGDRLRAMSVRFEGVDGRWLCTYLELI